MNFSRWSRQRWALIATAILAGIGTLDSILSLLDRWQGIDFAAIAGIARLVAGPIALALVVVLWRRPTRGLDIGVRPEWNSSNQVEHWEGVRAMANQASSRLREMSGRIDVTVGEQNELRDLTDALDLQAGTYSEMWDAGSFWDDRHRRRWELEARPVFDGPTWARPLWNRISYVRWWLTQRDPMSYEYDPWSA
jgi:hypothetical protein